MKKCIASQEGICRDIWGFEEKCNGYSEKCKLKKHYDAVSNIAERRAELARRVFGIKGDAE